MRVLLINNYHFHKGGADAVYFNTAELLQQNGHEVFFFSTLHPSNVHSDQEKYFTANYDFRNCSVKQKIKAIPSFIYYKKARERLANLLEEVKPDIAHIHLFMGGLSASILLALREKKIPVIQTVHDYRLLCPASSFTDGNNKICELCKDKFYLRCATKKCSEKNFAQSVVLGLDAYFRKYIVKPVDLINFFIFVSRFSMDKHIEFEPRFKEKSSKLFNFCPNLHAALPSSSKGDYLLYFGRLSIEKGIEVLIKAASKTNIPLKIVGTGPLLDQYKKYEGNGISFLGYKYGQELWDLVTNASFIVAPSVCYENNPLTIIEAYSFGKPVIGSRIGGIAEIIVDNETGYLFEMGKEEALSIILERAKTISDDEYGVMSDKARQYAQTYFNPDIHYKELIAIYSRVSASYSDK